MSAERTDHVILVAEDDARTRESLSRAMTRAGYRTLTAPDGASALALLATEPVDVLLTDLKMPRGDGLAVLERVRADFPDTIVVILTAFGTVDVAVEAMKKGAYDFLTKPIHLEKLELLLHHALESRRLAQENRELKLRLRETAGLKHLLGRSAPMQRLREAIQQVAATDAAVLVLGETGTGKELVAHAIHYGGRRADRPFVKVSCAALPEGLLESELFGHERGAFTGAQDRRKGRFELAHGGTLFLDEVGDMSPPTQAKLLRVLQEQEFERVGGGETLRVDVRVIAATNRDLEGLVAEGAFRDDLFYRLNVVPLPVPPLRDRAEDIPVLLAHFLRVFAERWGKSVPEVTSDALALLCRYAWPGNVRELQHVTESMLVFSKGGPITAPDLPAAVRGDERTAEAGERAPSATLRELERQAIARTLLATGGNRRKTAEILGIGLKTLYRKIQEFALP
ncbi:MAG: sigma-54-dependent Fis family transcriptional regulator [Candidatus Rokubacteria bacterium]|nr:sigma-54-dependent Fis family transcriptional regulator [Candidatus Rokubacteria bacterium]